VSTRRRLNRSRQLARTAARPFESASGPRGDFAGLREHIADVIADLPALDDTSTLELAASTLFGLVDLASLGRPDRAWTEVVLPELEAAATSRSAALLAAVAALADESVADAARSAMARLAADGTSAPPWTEDLTAPVTAEDCAVHLDAGQTRRVLSARLHRASDELGLVLTLDADRQGAADRIFVLEPAELTEILSALSGGTTSDKSALSAILLTPDAWRRHVAQAMATREMHDAATCLDPAAGFADLVGGADDSRAGYRSLAALARSWAGGLERGA
jgi:hypothetical protein